MCQTPIRGPGGTEGFFKNGKASFGKLLDRKPSRKARKIAEPSTAIFCIVFLVSLLMWWCQAPLKVLLVASVFKKHWSNYLRKVFIDSDSKFSSGNIFYPTWNFCTYCIQNRFFCLLCCWAVTSKFPILLDEGCLPMPFLNAKWAIAKSGLVLSDANLYFTSEIPCLHSTVLRSLVLFFLLLFFWIVLISSDFFLCILAALITFQKFVFYDKKYLNYEFLSLLHQFPTQEMKAS